MTEYSNIALSDLVFTSSSTTIYATIFVTELTPSFHYFSCFRYFNGKLRKGWPIYGNIIHQRFEINKNWCIVVSIHPILILTIFRCISPCLFVRPFIRSLISALLIRKEYIYQTQYTFLYQSFVNYLTPLLHGYIFFKRKAGMDKISNVCTITDISFACFSCYDVLCFLMIFYNHCLSVYFVTSLILY